MKIIFLGAPGAGKGTQAEIVSERCHIPALSTGNLLREAVAQGTELGKSAKGYMDRGELVPDDVVIGIIKQRMAEPDCANGFILDGFPRTVPQAEELSRMGVDLDRVVSIEVADKDIVRRMSGRRVCPKCGASYHLDHKPAANGTHCDKCGELLTIRKDDQPEVVESRLEVYHRQTEPLKDYYSKIGKLVCVQGQELLADTTRLTWDALADLA